MRLVVFIFAVLACVVSHTAYPAVMADTLAVRDSVTEIDEVVIMERRNVRGLRSTAPLQVVSRQAMMKMNVFQVSDAVKHFGGVTVKDYGGIGGLKTVSVRSLGAAHTAVSYDGITISDCQTGQIDIGRFSLDNVESVSLWSGQSDDIFMPARQMGAASLLDIRSSVPEFVGKPVSLYVAYVGTPEEGEAWRQTVQAAFPDRPVTADVLSLVIACHTGLGAFGIGLAQNLEL